jgi:uncharacterized RDD family membrane protein YckC
VRVRLALDSTDTLPSHEGRCQTARDTVVTAVAAPVAVLDTPDLAGYPTFLRPRVAAPSVYYAGFWVRVGINLVDAAIQAILYLVVNYVAQLVSGIITAVAHLPSDVVTFWTSIVSAVAVVLYYNLVLVARRGGTPGMRFGSLRIVRDSDLTVPPDRRTLYLRGVIYLAFTAVTPLRIIDALAIVFDQRKRSLHDVLTGTAVLRRAPPPQKLASLLCTVCGRPVDEGTLCPKHGGSMGLAITLSGHTVSLQVGASLLAVVAIVGIIVGAVMLVTSRPIGVIGIVVGVVLLRTTMSLTQLRNWARWVGSGAGIVIAVAMVGLAATQFSSSTSAGGFLLAGAAVGALITACLWTPETHRSFRRIPG